MAEVEEYIGGIKETLGPQVQVFPFWKGRVALYSILKSLNIGKGDEVIIPGFTCVVVPNAIIYTGAKPIYADVDEGTYTITRQLIEPLITPNTKAIIAQNTFGLSADLDPMIELATEHGIEVIDDCTHGFGGTYKGAPNGTRTRTAFFSTQWNKPYSTGIGGFAVSTDPVLSRKIAGYSNKAIQPSFPETFSLKLMIFGRQNLLTDATYWTLVRLYRWLSAKGLVVGSSQGEELESPQMPSDFLKAHSDLQCRVGSKKLASQKSDILFRKRMATKYDHLLLELGKTIPFQPEYAEHLFLKYPIRVKERDRFMELAERSKIRLGDWFISPLHPITGDLSAWNYNYGMCPVAEKLAKEVVNLPTDPDLSKKEIGRIMQFLKVNSELIL